MARLRSKAARTDPQPTDWDRVYGSVPTMRIPPLRQRSGAGEAAELDELGHRSGHDDTAADVQKNFSDLD